MPLYLYRADKNEKIHTCICDLFLNEDKTFTIYFNQKTDQILLNDHNYHSIDRLSGFVLKISIDKEGIYLVCFVNINGNFHHDSFMLHFREPKTL